MKRRHLATLLALLAAFAAHGGEVGADEAKAAALAFARQNAILRGHVLGVGEAFRHGAGIWVTDVAPGAMRFRLVDAGDADGSAAELATRDIPVTLEVGSTPGTLEPVEATPTLVDKATGVFEVNLKEKTSAPTRFFRLRARPNP